MCINGVEIGGGSIRIFDRDIQMKMFSLIGLTKEEAIKQFGFLLGAFEYGAPPHGGLAFGLDRYFPLRSPPPTPPSCPPIPSLTSSGLLLNARFMDLC